ncbi:hypothetical protein GGR56DRAFT_659984 [Xylariaceae sp. FL0804]|nr:hypothetical protein GGR56DRAFT_659984 [Xylariaceae sp. FL0804]
MSMASSSSTTGRETESSEPDPEAGGGGGGGGAAAYHRSPLDDSGVSITSDSVDVEGAGTHAERACEKCRVGKRKCDKALPECGRCARLSIPCVYLFDASPEASSANGGAAPTPVPRPRDLAPLLRGHDPLTDISAQDVLALLDSLDVDLPSLTKEYFIVIHPWLAVIHPLEFQRTYQSLAQDRGSDYVTDLSQLAATASLSRECALLLVMMYLVIRPKPELASLIWDEVYLSVKRLLALMGCTNQPSIEYIQISTLMALYEFGHGDTFTAYRTLNDAVGAANVRGICPGRAEDYAANSCWETAEEEQNATLWWGLFVIDQCIHADWPAKRLPFLLETPAPSTLLPATIITSISHVGPSRRIPLSVGISAELVPFQKAALVANMLHRALRWDYERDKRARLPPLALLLPLDTEIRSITHSLLRDNYEWESVADCFAMCVSALFAIYLPYLPEPGAPLPPQESLADPSNTSDLAQALAALRFACQLSFDITCRLYERGRRAPGRYTALAAPSAAPSCFWAVVGFAGLSRVFTRDAELMASRIKERFESLEFLGGRWGIANSIRGQLERYCGIRRGHYLVPPDGGPARALDEYPAVPPRGGGGEGADAVMGGLDGG